MRFFKNKKAQAALEYMVTYGWAFLVIIASIGVLAYFGFLNPNKYIPDNCDFGEQLKCVDHFIDADADGNNGRILLRFQNNFEEDINVSSIYPIDRAVTMSDYTVISKGSIARVEIDVGGTETIFPGDKERFTFILTFKRAGGTIEHNITGLVFTEVAENQLGLT